MKKTSGFDPQIERCWIEWRTVHGMYEVFLYSPNFMCPIGYVYGIAAGRGNTNEPQFSIIHAYTIEFARRKGVQRRLRKWIFEAWSGKNAIQRITTPNASEHGGLESMRRMGYRHIKSADCWVLTRDRFFKRAK